MDGAAAISPRPPGDKSAVCIDKCADTPHPQLVQTNGSWNPSIFSRLGGRRHLRASESGEYRWAANSGGLAAASRERSAKMKLLAHRLFAGVLFLAIAVAPALAVRIGQPAPDFTATASNGKTYDLSDFRGKFVVLEWHNNGCPYTRKHYESGNMQRLQKEWTAKGVLWFTIISSAPGSQGYVTAQQENEYLKRMDATPTAALLDPSGKIGHLYDAKTTPQMILIGRDGKLLYDGAIDNHASTSLSSIKGARNYISEALSEAMAGQPVRTPTTRPYGCSVKYGN
jgi:AhpC/TSA family